MAVPQELVANDTATGTLAADPGSGGTTLTLTTGHGARFPTIATGQQFRVRVENEIMVVTAHTAAADTMTVTRGAEGTTAAAHAIGTNADMVLTKAAFERWETDYTLQPRMWGCLTWSHSPATWISTQAVTAGVVYCMKAWTPEPMTFASIFWSVRTAGVTGTATLWHGVYNSAGTLLGKTADLGAQVTSTGNKGPAALTVEGGQSLTVTGGPGTYVWLATLCGVQNTGTPWATVAASGGNSGDANFNLTGANLIAGQVLTGQTALPATITPANITLSAWRGIAAA